MEILDKRKVNEEGQARVAEPEKRYDSFRPTLAGFIPDNGAVLLRELVLPEEGLIQTPDAYAEDCLFAEVIAGANKGSIVRILKGVGHTIPFAEEGQRYFTVHREDIIGHWEPK